jgi:hypothetical protein
MAQPLALEMFAQRYSPDRHVRFRALLRDFPSEPIPAQRRGASGIKTSEIRFHRLGSASSAVNWFSSVS